MNGFIETIQQYGKSIWEWFTINKDAITAFFMSGQFLSFVGAVVALVKTMSAVKTNTQSSKTLNSTLEKTNEMSESVTKVDGDVTKLTEENVGLRKELSSVYEKLEYGNNQLIEKLNAILDVQSVVYSTIRDDSVRQTVNTMLNNARYSDANTREKLQAQIDELKSTFDTEVANVKDIVDKVIDNVSNNLNAVEMAKKKAQELKNIEESTRY